jgi:hypothetical protein
MTRAQRRALDTLHEEVDAEFEKARRPHQVAPSVDRLIEVLARWSELLHRAGAGQPSALADMRRLAQIGHQANGKPCPLRCTEPALDDAHADDCPVLGAMGRYPMEAT